jgi:hypothetical protein
MCRKIRYDWESWTFGFLGKLNKALLLLPECIAALFSFSAWVCVHKICCYIYVLTPELSALSAFLLLTRIRRFRVQLSNVVVGLVWSECLNVWWIMDGHGRTWQAELVPSSVATNAACRRTWQAELVASSAWLPHASAAAVLWICDCAALLPRPHTVAHFCINGMSWLLRSPYISGTEASGSVWPDHFVGDVDGIYIIPFAQRPSSSFIHLDLQQKPSLS